MTKKEIAERGHWNSKAEFLLACLGSSVGFGNVWRFPYLAFENGGAAFLFPYIIIMVFIGKPMYFMETALGQFSQKGPMHAWNCAPVMKGLGYSQVLGSIFGSSKYIMLMAYTIFYLAYAFAYIGHPIPWSTCDPKWADENCYEAGNIFPCSKYNLTESTQEINCTNRTVSSGAQFWEKVVLRVDKGGLTTFGNIGDFHWQLSLCLLLIWLITYFSVMKGIKSSAKVVYFTATFPFLAVAIILVAGVQLPGASRGLKYLFIPNWSKMMDPNVWRKAAGQVLYSLSISGGSLITFGSYNKFDNKLQYDVLLLTSLDFVVSIVAGISIFSVLGAMAEELNLDDVGQVAAGGPGLAFIAYPEAISRTLPYPHLWTILFFFTLLTLGIDSLFAMLETFLTTVYDVFPWTRSRKAVFSAIVCIVCFVVGVHYCGTLGPYIFYLLDKFGSGIGGLLFATVECISLHWFYGVNRFSKDVEFMLGYKPNILLKLCWTVAAPATFCTLLIMSMMDWQIPVYRGHSYPQWALAIGWMYSLQTLAIIPFVFIVVVIKNIVRGDWRASFRPSPDWGPGCPEARIKLAKSQEVDHNPKNECYITHL